MTIPKASIGRIVHLTAPGKSEPWAAIVTLARDDNRIDVMAFPPGDNPRSFAEVVHASPEDEDMVTWKWPPCTEAAP